MKALADAVGIAVIGIMCTVLAVFVPAKLVNPGLIFFAFLAVSVMCMYFWHHQGAPSGSGGWLWFAAISVVAGILSLGADYLIGLINGASGSIMEVASSHGGIALTAGVCPVMTAIGLAGALRARVLNQ